MGQLVTRPPHILNGHIMLPTAPGWGADINEEVLRAHPWPRGTGTETKLFYGMRP